MTAAAPRPLTAPELRSMLGLRYPEPEWMLFDEAGGKFGRRTDVIAFNLWSSRGYGLQGFELKVNRSDLRRELNNPAKCEESLFQYCDHWWLVTAAEVAVNLEVPPTWGWIEQRGAKLFTRKRAPALEPKPVTRAVMSSLLTRIQNTRLAEKREIEQRDRSALRTQMEQEYGGRLRRAEEEARSARAEGAELRRLHGGWTNHSDMERTISLAKAIRSSMGAVATIKAQADGLAAAAEQFLEAQRLMAAGDRGT